MKRLFALTMGMLVAAQLMAADADGRACNNDIVLFRYADVLLMKAEALVRCGLSGNEQFNMVRTRVGLPSAEATLENILHERMVELAWGRLAAQRHDPLRHLHPTLHRPPAAQW